MKRSLLLVLAVLAVTGCSSKPTPPETIEVSYAQLNNYWRKIRKSVSFKTGAVRATLPEQAGHVVVRYLVDSKGYVSDISVVQSHPTGAWDQFALHAVRNLRFVPSPLNEKRVPVYVTQRFDFNRG